MANNWPIVSVEELAAPIESALATGPFGSSISSRLFQDAGVPVIRGSNLSQEVGVRLIDDDIVFVAPEKAAEFKRSTVKKGDLIFTCWGTITQVGLIDERAKYPSYVISNKQMKFTPDPARADSLFVYYTFSSPSEQHIISSRGIGSSVPGFNLGQLRSIRFTLPPLAEQRRIAHILGTLDDKIELNRQLNATLEQLARALFQSWFVDFDPVRAKASGEAPDSICRRLGLTPELLALFPAELEASALGEVPAGWENQAFSEIVNLLGGGTPKTKVTEYWDGDVPWFSVVDAPNESDIFVVDTEKKISEAGLLNSSTRLLPPYTTIISARGTVGRLALTGCPMTMNQSCYGITGKEAGPFFTYFATRQLVQHLQQSSHGTVFDTITRDTFSRVHLAVPSLELMEAYDDTIRHMMQSILQNVEESRTLATLRDELLPKLLSGDIRLN